MNYHLCYILLANSYYVFSYLKQTFFCNKVLKNITVFDNAGNAMNKLKKFLKKFKSEFKLKMRKYSIILLDFNLI